MQTLKISQVLIFFLLIFSFKSKAQKNCFCYNDLNFVNEQITYMKSYKKQIKGERLIQYNFKLDKLRRQSEKISSVRTCYLLLNELLSEIKDKHAFISHKNPQFSEKKILNENRIQQYLKNEAFVNFPKTTENITKLRAYGGNKDFNEFEGIYTLPDSTEIGVISKENEYQGIVLYSNSPFWIEGQIRYVFKPKGDHMFDVITSTIPGGRVKYIPGMLHANGSIWNLKKSSEKSFIHLDETHPNWEFKQLNDSVQYVRFGSFSNSKKNIDEFKIFYKQYKDKFTAQNLIVDLRDNGGGNSKYSDPFYKIFKKKKPNIFVITNFYSVSNAEQFTLKLKNLPNTVHLGQRTYGAIAYGSNYGRTYDSPSGHFYIYPTDMNFHKYINYENVGINPDKSLDANRDWIEQTLEYIRYKN